MGVVNNECIIATTWANELILKLKKWIETLPEDQQSLFAFIPCICNGKKTVVLGPDGSKKGWGEADRGEELRNTFIEKLKEFNYKDGSNPFNYVEVGYGEYGQKVLRGNCTNIYGDSEYCGI